MSGSTLPSIVRWIPVLVLTAACGADGPLAPASETPSKLETDATLALAKGGKGKGNGGENGRWGNGNANLGKFDISEQRLYQIRYYPDPDPARPGIYRMCQLNPLEDADGGDWLTETGKLHMVEPDALVLIKEFQASEADVVWDPEAGTWRAKTIALNYGLVENPLGGTETWKLTWLGRAKWSFNAWLSGAGEISRHSEAKGVVAPVPADLRAEAELYADGVTGDGGLFQFTRGVDLFNTPLQPARKWVREIDDLLDQTYLNRPQDLRYLACDADFFKFVTHNEVVTADRNIPGGLLHLIPAAR